MANNGTHVSDSDVTTKAIYDSMYTSEDLALSL